jgi:hypothetical protein
MAFCYHCGEEIEFINNGFGPIPIHPSGSCSGRSSGGYGGGRTYSMFRTTGDGDVFEFPFVTYPSYINPNARCPVCGASVYFYQSPYGGRVFFDELGPPWPKHPCTDNPVVRHHFASAESRLRFLVGASSEPSEHSTEENEDKEPEPRKSSSADAAHPRLAAWVEAGWMPFVVTRIVPRPIGVEAEGKLFVSAGSEGLGFRIVQASADARFYRTQGQLRIGFALVQNSSPVLSVLNQCPILLKKDPDLHHLTLSSFIMTCSGEVEEIILPVLGIENNELPT